MDSGMLIYKITNTVNNKVYVGQTKLEQKEFLKSNYWGSGLLILRAAAKYGTGVLQREVIEECVSKEDANVREVHWIKTIGTLVPVGYNISIGGNGGNLGEAINKRRGLKLKVLMSGAGNPMYGKHHTAETRQKISVIHYGKPSYNRTAEILQKQSVAQTGKTIPEEQRQRISLALKGEKSPKYGTKDSTETREKKSKALKGRVFTAEWRAKISAAKKGRSRKINNTAGVHSGV